MTLPRSIARQHPGQYALLFVLFGMLGVFLLYPIGLTVYGAFVGVDEKGQTHLTLSHVAMVFADPTARAGLVNAFMVAAATTLVAILVALPLSVFSARYRFPLKGAFSALILVPLILPPFVGAIGMQALLGRYGTLNTLLGTEFDVLGGAKFWGVVLVEALHLYPIIYLNATAALANLDPALDEAAENLGAGPVRRFFRVTLPLIRPGLFAGATIVFIWSFTELGTPLVFDYNQVTPVQIFVGLKEVESSARPYAMVVVMLGAAIGIYAIGKAVFGRKGYAMYSKASRAASEKELGRGMKVVATGAFGVVTLLAVLPHLGVILTSVAVPGTWYRTLVPAGFTLGHYDRALTDPDAFGSVVNSLKLASMAMVLDLGLGLLVGYVIVRGKVRGKRLLDALCMLPLAVPGLVMAFGYVAMSLRWPFGKGNPLESVSVFGATPDPTLLLVIAYAVRRLPYVVRATVAGLEQTSGELEEAALNLGASRVTTVRRVIVPLIAANLIAGGLLAFSFAMLEVSDSLLLAQQPEDFPITNAIVAFLNRLGDGPYIASAMGVWGMALLAVTLVGASILIGKKMGSIFRV